MARESLLQQSSLVRPVVTNVYAGR